MQLFRNIVTNNNDSLTHVTVYEDSNTMPILTKIIRHTLHRKISSPCGQFVESTKKEVQVEGYVLVSLEVISFFTNIM